MIHDEAVVDHGAPLVPVRAVRDEADIGEVGLDGVLHGPVDLLDMGEVGNGVHGAEHGEYP